MELEEGEEPPPPPEPVFEKRPGEAYFIMGHADSVQCTAFCPVASQDHSGYTLATSSLDATIRLWHMSYAHRTGTNSAAEVLGAPIQALSPFVEWSPDGATIATSAESIYFQLWSGVSGHPRNVDPLAGHVSGLTNAAFAPMGQTVVSASEDGTIRFWHFLMSRNIVEIAQLESKQMKFNEDMIVWEKKLIKTTLRIPFD